jgi:hypothetical protein
VVSQEWERRAYEVAMDGVEMVEGGPSAHIAFRGHAFFLTSLCAGSQ